MSAILSIYIYVKNKNNFHYNYIDLGDIFNENIPDRNYEQAAQNKIAQRTSIVYRYNNRYIYYVSLAARINIFTNKKRVTMRNGPFRCHYHAAHRFSSLASMLWYEVYVYAYLIDTPIPIICPTYRSILYEIAAEIGQTTFPIRYLSKILKLQKQHVNDPCS